MLIEAPVSDPPPDLANMTVSHVSELCKKLTNSHYSAARDVSVMNFTTIVVVVNRFSFNVISQQLSFIVETDNQRWERKRFMLLMEFNNMQILSL